jgi:hypothetical protein
LSQSVQDQLSKREVIECLPIAGEASRQMTGIERLSQYAWRFRYPGAPYSSEEAEAEEARHAAGELLSAVRGQIEKQFGK